MNTATQTDYSVDLHDLLSGHVDADLLLSCSEIKIKGMQLDSRQVKTGDLFCALFGKNHDARDYIDLAVANGAAAVLADTGGSWQDVSRVADVPVIAVSGLRARLGDIAARFYRHPSSNLQIIGVTGTNGKTSCTQFIAQMLNRLEQPCGVVGTLGYGVYPDLRDTGFTTPDALAVQAALADLYQRRAKTVAMEASSQGLHQHRLKSVEFYSAVFTNLTRDHLDYHGTMEAYAESKRRLFECSTLKVGIVNMDDSHAAVMLNALPRCARSFTYSVNNRLADVSVRELSFRADGFDAYLQTPWGDGQINSQLLGAFNLSNVLAAVCAVMTMPENYSLEAVLKAASSLESVNGRMAVVGSAGGMTAVVDYAHTPDGLRSALEAVRQHTKGKVWCVFGCGGNRDQGKRPLMAEVAEELADKVIVTDDNPRLENADDIVRQILFGFSNRAAVLVERDRATAISLAITQAGAGDVVLVAGKGHENYQDVRGQRMAFSDASQVRLALQRRTQAAGNDPASESGAQS
ncbi:MAG: UDP-N-acetylmuramoyl-L-alanyl-D-glutamate--2,6-diaminopimelate ligase [Pseudohongiella sp.]|nr:UDP-N-acetylmuramoyl-L-alanyl-D-glutamate--2,6-diaminopimelate ligase [Pseudohongiella sp.]MDO9520878.1 UDP-N-acetylmuramoyl-L-alanyl-D-glutamate--2,6-diaminopimelate ligase [Pseudohongiella sp.]MDP2128059.1 UDP-N-acetylmuramoyl-L-alanyl-D-glutamate--2,6-diaminopimelate ligase [Pseudohongiella sp.]